MLIWQLEGFQAYNSIWPVKIFCLSNARRFFFAGLGKIGQLNIIQKSVRLNGHEAHLSLIVPESSFSTVHNWRAPWKNRISSTTMKLRKSLVKPVTRQNISSCWFIHPRSSCMMQIMLFSERPLIYASSCVMILGGRTEQLNIIAGFLPCHWLYEWFSSAENVRRYMCHAWWSAVEEPNDTL